MSKQISHVLVIVLSIKPRQKYARHMCVIT